MSTPYLFIDSKQVDSKTINIEDIDDIRHLYGPLRVKAGDFIYISDNKSFRYRAAIKRINKKEAILEIVERRPISEPIPRITLFQCILKKTAMENAIQKTTEIGTSRIIPVISSRTVADIKDNDQKMQRWQKISDEASKQSKRDFKCLIGQPLILEDIDTDSYGYFFVPYEGIPAAAGDDKRLEGISSASEIGYLIGPEGGLDPRETEFMEKRGTELISLGKNILRAETAAVYFLSIMDFYIRSSK